MTYSDWREELILTEGAKTRFILKGIKKLKGIIKKPKRNIFPIGSTKASGRLPDVDPDLFVQFPGVNYRKLIDPNYKANRNPKLAKAIKYVKSKLERAKNPNLKGASPYSTDVPSPIPNVRTPVPPKLSQQIKSNLSKGTKLTDDQKKKNLTDYIKSLTKKVKDKNKKNKNLKTYEGDDKYYPPEIGESAIAIKGGSKLIPLLMTGIGAAGTIMQARKYRTRNSPEGKRKKRKIGSMEKRLMGREQGDRSNDMIVARRGEADKQNKLIDKYEKKYTSQQQKNTRRNIIRGLKSGNIQDEFSAPTNSMGGGAIAGSVEAGDNPPVKKKKRYIYGGTGSRKMWMNNK